MTVAYRFTAHGHRNILATHKNTLELTKDKELSLDGDCIVGVEADFSLAQLQKLAKEHNTLLMRITSGGFSDEVEFMANKGFSSDRELVLRFSEFSSDRTFGFRASKAAAQLDRRLAEKMAVPGQTITVEIEPMVKAIIFDFDDTVEDFKSAREQAHMKIAEMLLERHGIFEPTTVKLLEEIDREASHRGMGADIAAFDRHPWFERLFKTLGISVTADDIDAMVNAYWTYITDAVKPMPYAAETLAELKKCYKTALMSDSDGDREIKMRRVRKTGLGQYFDVLMTSDEIGRNKPNEEFYSKILSALGVKSGECVMVGDKPQVDLELAKKLGMKTVWMKHGRWSERQAGMRFEFVDFEITDLRQMLEAMRQV
jgi:HAD superfamily hydrolase (TIGR01509 family)